MKSRTAFEQLLAVLKIAQKSKIYFDPHPKNFVIKENILTYVDFTPPWIEPYFNIRILKADNDEKNILTDFFKCMHWNELGFHLAGDLLKIDNKNSENLIYIYNQLLDYKLIPKGYNSFVKHAKAIIQKEKIREEKNIFLL